MNSEASEGITTIVKQLKLFDDNDSFFLPQRIQSSFRLELNNK